MSDEEKLLGFALVVVFGIIINLLKDTWKY